ncbi:MAG: Uma2 family endonuclease [Planctomycetota bacterium]|nr:Uma2 family endonuclease [Planctomycetota bacterium]
MTTAAIPDTRTLADMLEDLGNISPDRVLMHPPPGTATEQDAIDYDARRERLCELVDGVLVEKAVGYHESIIAIAIATMLRTFVVSRNLGFVSGPDGMMRLFPGLIRMPDVTFASWSRFPEGKLPRETAPDLAPDLVVEVVSLSNTPGEMERKRQEYFAAGVLLVWMIDHRNQTATVYTSPGEYREFSANESLDGGDVLPGFTLSLAELFSELDRQASDLGPEPG